jgi:site-specific recombinase XerD
MPDLKKNDPAFLAAYVAATGSAPKPARKSFGSGTIGAGITAYLGSSNYLGMASSTRERWRSRCDDFRLKYGVGKLNDLTARHIKLDLSDFEGHGSNNRLKVWRSLCSYWDEIGMIDINVALQVSKKKTEKTDGFTPWSRQDFAAFRAHWPVCSKERLAFELMYRTCAAIADTCRLSRSMLSDDGWLTYTRQKSKSTAISPFYADGPDWFEATNDLQACLDVAPLHVVFLTTQHGKPRSAKSASQWFSKAATVAGLDADKAAHGVRKGRAAMFKENGAPADKRMAVLGHETEAEATHYSKSADLRRIIEGTQKFQLSEQVPTPESKTLKLKGNNNAR